MFGAELRSQRTGRRLSLRALAHHVNYSYSYLAKIETGDRSPPSDLAARLDTFFNTGELFEQLLEHGNSIAAATGRGLVAVERENGKVEFVPPSRRQLLRGAVGSTALAVLASGRASQPVLPAHRKPIELLHAARQTLINEDNIFGPQYVIPKVQRQIADVESMLSAGVDGADGRELRFLQASLSEFCGWLYQDYGDHAAAQEWLNVALNRALLAGDGGLTTFILARQSQLAGDMGDAQLAIDAARAAIRSAPDERLAAVAHTYAAHGYALAQSQADSDRSYDLATELNQKYDGNSPWGVWLDTSYIAVHRAHSLTHLGRFDGAISEYQAAIDKLPPDFRRDRGVYLARQAVAFAGGREADAAAQAGMEALAIAIETQSGRIATTLTEAARALRSQNTVLAREFRATLQDSIQA